MWNLYFGGTDLISGVILERSWSPSKGGRVLQKFGI